MLPRNNFLSLQAFQSLHCLKKVDYLVHRVVFISYIFSSLFVFFFFYPTLPIFSSRYPLKKSSGWKLCLSDTATHHLRLLPLPQPTLHQLAPRIRSYTTLILQKASLHCSFLAFINPYPFVHKISLINLSIFSASTLPILIIAYLLWIAFITLEIIFHIRINFISVVSISLCSAYITAIFQPGQTASTFSSSCRSPCITFISYRQGNSDLDLLNTPLFRM